MRDKAKKKREIMTRDDAIEALVNCVVAAHEEILNRLSNEDLEDAVLNDLGKTVSIKDDEFDDDPDDEQGESQ